MASMICSKRLRSLTGSLIDKRLITVYRLSGKWEQTFFFHQIHWSMQFLLQIYHHSSNLKKAYSLRTVIHDQYIYVAFLRFLTT